MKISLSFLNGKTFIVDFRLRGVYPTDFSELYHNSMAGFSSASVLDQSIQY